jgi:Flp pilus assembly protein TadG
MACTDRRCSPAARRGTAAAELAVVLPFLGFIFVVALDYGRIFYYDLTVANCARAGALYGSSDPTHATDTTGIQNAATADATNLTPAPTVSATTGNDGSGNPYVRVTVSYTFQTLTNYPLIPTSTTLSHTVQMRVVPP